MALASSGSPVHANPEEWSDGTEANGGRASGPSRQGVRSHVQCVAGSPCRGHSFPDLTERQERLQTPVEGRVATERVVVEGIGRTPQEALHNGLCRCACGCRWSCQGQGRRKPLRGCPCPQREVRPPLEGNRRPNRGAVGAEACHRKLAVVVNRQGRRRGTTQGFFGRRCGRRRQSRSGRGRIAPGTAAPGPMTFGR